MVFIFVDINICLTEGDAYGAEFYGCEAYIGVEMKVSYSLLIKIAAGTVVVLFCVYLGLKSLKNDSGRDRRSSTMGSTDGDALDCDERADYLMNLLRTREDQHKKDMDRLKDETREVQEQLNSKLILIRKLESDSTSCGKTGQSTGDKSSLVGEKSQSVPSQLQSATKQGDKTRDYVITQEELVRNAKPQTKIRNEYEVIPWDSFTKDRVYHIEDGLAKRPEERPIGDRKREHSEVLSLAVKLLNDESTDSTSTMTADDLVEGYSRLDRTQGTSYELFFRTKTKQVYKHLELFRPFAPIHRLSSSEVIDYSHEWINVIMPLHGRLDKFQAFMEMFMEMCVKQDKRVFLTIVYFGDEGREEAHNILESVSKANHYRNYKFLTQTGTFSRGRGLLYGAQQWEQGNVLMFFCDVDIAFDTGFLDRCRLNSRPGKKVYYPVVFSLYNPAIVYADKRIPPEREQLVMRRDSGFWRDFGFGMTCQYRDDFFNVKGFDTSIEGWGGEDVQLYRKYIRSNIQTIRAVDRGIYHLYHEKYCEPTLSKDQYKMCVGSKALSEASHSQLGLLAFKSSHQTKT